MQITGSLVDWHMERSRADGLRQQWERVARYRKDPLRYMDGRRSIGAPAVQPWVPDGPVPEWVPPAPVEPASCEHCNGVPQYGVCGCANARRAREMRMRDAINPALLRNDPSPADLTEMRLEQSMQSIVDAWEAYQRNRDAFIARFNIEAQHHRMGCKLIRWKAYQ